MEFSSKEDIEAPVAEVFAILSEFESFERSAIRRGVEVQRVDQDAPVGAGMAWDTRFNLRGRPREMHVVLTQFEPPQLMRFEGHSKNIDSIVTIELLALSPRRTRLSLGVELGAKSLSARLFLQSLKLAKKNLTRRFKLRMAEFAKEMEDRCARARA
ncbi:SRPBCC family protein [Ruegeria marina]|uniref:Polyketide cyclase / dehydrase and lipid transport n=1 Tax=Ruegeria marina TaxID=639004 RepID=A0A1G7A8D9_9RHOB|nr:SRPBCC family protein [Ruegeria marina]SDE11144.1 Polyketide cyclase / dehydrase and lipid transport [Ruegeria marina]